MAAMLRGLSVFLMGLSLLVGTPSAGNAEERTVSGTIVRLDRETRSLSVRDGKGAVWNYRVDTRSGIDMKPFRVGDFVSVTIARGTPLNMVTSSDLLRKGDRIVRYPGN